MNNSLSSRINEAVGLLQQSGIIAYPTDTLYGLGADVFDEVALNRIFTIKNRPYGMPLPILISSVDMLSDVASDVSQITLELAKTFWPGPLTLVLPKTANIPSIIAARGWTVAVRVPNHPLPRELSRLLKRPITGTSANYSGGRDLLTAPEVRTELGHLVDMIIDSPPKPSGQASTILDLTSTKIRLIRQGAISMQNLESICGPINYNAP